MRTTEIRWSDRDAGPYLVTVGWRLLGERWEPVELTTTVVPEQGMRPLHTTDLRALRLPAIVARATVELRRQLKVDRDALEAAPAAPPSSRREYRLELLRRREAAEALQAAQPRGRGRPPIPLGELREVARIYAEAFRAKRPPTRAVAETLGLSYAAAAKRVASCRKVGVLGAAEQGKARVGMVMGRGDATTLRRQIARDEVMEQRRSATDEPEEL